jgi:hypothetical protein
MHTFVVKNCTCRISLDGLQLLLTISKNLQNNSTLKILTQIGIAREENKIFQKTKII